MSQSPTPYIYADNAATTPLSPVALDAMMPYLTSTFGNPSGIHRIARDAARALEAARRDVASCLGANADEVYFTSGGSESDNWVLRAAVARFRDLWGSKTPVRVITSAVEHHAILHCCRALERSGVEVTYLPVDNQGFVSADDLDRTLTELERADASEHEAPAAALVSVMLANNEVGTIEDIASLAAVAHSHGVPFHTDAVQAVGHIPIDVHELGVDALSLSGHKFHGPRGVGALYLRDGFSLPPLIEGGAQERGERAGTENVAGIVGMAAALKTCVDNLDERRAHVAQLRDRLVAGIVGAVDDVRPTGPSDPYRRLPSIASFICHDVDGELLVMLLDRAGVAAATGSACSTGSTDPSHVVTALGVTDRSWNRGTLRLSLADDITDADVDLLIERVTAIIKRARTMSAMSQISL
ncbi:cysteine desulfurase family protein [Collinsella sp. An2]|uniref:cysteine desulfurase family protein n=1 Tax=Collinsella sp. An2 TaxID=1965585 RepID=UPI000B394DC2|nr:cysteine desulfurase family protein [Collinsella sp. An2]OUP10432.1 aminotransferase [Collinsella sp. An2]